MITTLLRWGDVQNASLLIRHYFGGRTYENVCLHFFFNVFIASLHFDRFGDCNYVPPRFTDLQLFSWGGVQYCKWRFTSPPSRMSAGGRFGGFGGGYGVTGLLRTFIFHPPLSKCKNFRLRNTTLGGSTLAISRPLRKISEGGKIAIYIFDTSPCFQLA